MAASWESEFDALATASATRLYRSAWLLCGDHHQAEDLVQETLARVYERMSKQRLGKIDNPVGYSQTTLTRLFISSRRRRMSTEVPYADLPDSSIDESNAELALELREVLAQLSPTDRAVVVLRYLEDLSVSLVAERLSLTSSAVQNRSMRALARLREWSGQS